MKHIYILWTFPVALQFSRQLTNLCNYVKFTYEVAYLTINHGCLNMISFIMNSNQIELRSWFFQVPVDPKDPTRADRTVPSQLYIAQSGISGAGRGVWSKVVLSKGLRFGPYEGAKVESSNSNGYCWQVRSDFNT
jgi:hypothetical protein